MHSYEHVPATLLIIADTLGPALDVETSEIYGGLSEGGSVAHLSTWQLQQTRRAARARARLPWRDSQIDAERALDATRHELMRRGAWTLPAHLRGERHPYGYGIAGYLPLPA